MQLETKMPLTLVKSPKAGKKSEKIKALTFLTRKMLHKKGMLIPFPKEASD